MTPDEFVTAWMSLLDKNAHVNFYVDMRLYTCDIRIYNEAADEWELYEASGDINVPNPVALFAQAYADMKAGRKQPAYDGSDEDGGSK